MKKIKQFKLNNKGFTLIEMMLVLLVISVLVILVIPNASSYINKANATGCDAITQTIQNKFLSEDLLDEETTVTEKEINKFESTCKIDYDENNFNGIGDDESEDKDDNNNPENNG